MWYNLYKTSNIDLGQQLMALRPQLAMAAQQSYNNWAQDDTGFDEELGEGGICQDIADAMAGVINSAITDANVHILDAQVGDQHVWVLATRQVSDGEETYQEGYHVDISPSLYETGGGYSWKKIPGVIFDESFISIHKANRNDIPTDEY